jgi:hypothetical protein
MTWSAAAARNFKTFLAFRRRRGCIYFLSAAAARNFKIFSACRRRRRLSRSAYTSIYRVAQKSVYREKIEYLHYGSSKRADFFTTDKGVFIVHTHKENVEKHCFELSSVTWIQKFNILRNGEDDILNTFVIRFWLPI